MIRPFIQHTLGVLLLFGLHSSTAQKKYDTSAEATTVVMEEKTISGFRSPFDFSREAVRKGWWAYSKEFSQPLNMKTYYKVTIPSETTDGNVDLEIFTQTSAGKSGCSFFLGLENDEFEDQARRMLLEFKKEFYIRQLADEIACEMQQSKAIGKAYQKTVVESERKNYLNEIVGIAGKVEKLKGEIREIELK